MYSVAILMSTYNGELFLKEQINSLLLQTVNNLKIYIRDDGSNDSTKNILSAYCKEHPDKFKIYFGDNIGSSSSFLWLLQNIEADIYFFCDQDDIWEDHKVHEHIIHYDRESTPKMVFSDMSVLGNQETTFLKMQKLDPQFLVSKPLRLLCQNCIAGTSMSFNLAARNTILKHAKFPDGVIHDHWISVLILMNGEVEFIPASLVKYRLHENNQVGAHNFNMCYVLQRLAKLSETISHDLLLTDCLFLRNKPFVVTYFFTKVFVNLYRLFRANSKY